ncbi:hypothetical protein L208DRAFT_1385569 [Tricholoma matsutake]|nr:hypothetical protein L208DRAFT_1385569 [Tricholoma matsutake 945]
MPTVKPCYVDFRADRTDPNINPLLALTINDHIPSQDLLLLLHYPRTEYLLSGKTNVDRLDS